MRFFHRKNWDLIFPHLKVWHNIILDLRSFNRLVVPTRYGNLASAKRVELHGFSDASIAADGCYILHSNTGQDGSIHSTLVTSKSQVSPIKQVSSKIGIARYHVISTCYHTGSFRVVIIYSHIHLIVSVTL